MQVYASTQAGARVRVPVLLSTLALATWLTPVPEALAKPTTDLAPAPIHSASVDQTVRAQVGTPQLEQHSRRGSSSGGDGQATPRGGAGGGSGSGGGSAGGGRSSGGSSGGGSGSGGTSTGSPRTRSGSGSDGSQGTATARPRDGRPVEGTAVQRRDNGGSSGGDRDRTVIVGGGYYGGFYPWGWGGLGLGGYWGGYYDPWDWGGYDPYGPYGPSRRYWSGNEGSLRLRVTPRQAEVYVDGYFAGSVDDYDGTFQRLRLEPGPHRIEVRLDHYEPLSFEVRIPPGRTVTFRGTLERDDRDDRDARDDNR